MLFPCRTKPPLAGAAKLAPVSSFSDEIVNVVTPPDVLLVIVVAPACTNLKSPAARVPPVPDASLVIVSSF